MRAVPEVFSDLSEQLNYHLPDFPLYVRQGALLQFDRYAAACHWHSDLEFILVLDGYRIILQTAKQCILIGVMEFSLTANAYITAFPPIGPTVLSL
jgi:hypothetical protein